MNQRWSVTKVSCLDVFYQLKTLIMVFIALSRPTNLKRQIYVWIIMGKTLHMNLMCSLISTFSLHALWQPSICCNYFSSLMSNVAKEKEKTLRQGDTCGDLDADVQQKFYKLSENFLADGSQSLSVTESSTKYTNTLVASRVWIFWKKKKNTMKLTDISNINFRTVGIVSAILLTFGTVVGFFGFPALLKNMIRRVSFQAKSSWCR